MTEKDATHAPWQREFFKNIEGLMRLGMSEEEAKGILVKFLKLSGETPMPKVMESFRSEEALEEVGVHTMRNPEIRDFMVEFLSPLMSKFVVEGKENLDLIIPLMGKFPMALVSNHLSHLDAPAIYNLLYREGGDARQLAEALMFIAGRLAFEPDFTRLGLYMFDTLLVCSQKDMADNPGMADLMTRINMRSFRKAQALQKEGKIIAVFPEGTRSRTGKLINFVDAVYHYVANKVVIPVSLAGTAEILPTESFLFNATAGKLVIGKPVLVGSLSSKLMAELPDSVQRMDIPPKVDKKQYVIDALALLVGAGLHRHQHGSYRNLYLAEGRSKANILIKKSSKPVERAVVIGHSQHGVAAAAILANKKVEIKIYLDDPEKVAEFNDLRADKDHFPVFKLPPNIEFTANPADIADATLFVNAARPWELDYYYSRVKLYLQKSNGPIINVIKGFTGSERGLITDDIQHDYGIPPERLMVMAGANYPDQVMERKLTGYEIAANEPGLVNHLAMLFSSDYTFTRPAVNPSDVRGVQLGGALSNVYALGIGLLDGYYERELGGNSDNSLFHISNRIFKEMSAVGVALGGQESTFTGLSGMTDLMHSCFSQDARDRKYGHDLIFGIANPDRKSQGTFGICALPNLLDLNPDKFPVAAAIHAVVVQGIPAEKVLDTAIYQLRRY